MTDPNGDDILTYVVVIVDHSPGATIGESFQRFFTLLFGSMCNEREKVETFVCPNITEYTQIREFLINRELAMKHFLTIFDWPLEHQHENHADEEKALRETLWESAAIVGNHDLADTPDPKIGYRQQYLYTELSLEEVTRRMRADPKIYGSQDKPLPLMYFPVLGGFKKLRTMAKDLYMTASGRIVRPGS